MRWKCLAVLLLLAAAPGCATQRAATALSMPATDEASAASLLAGYMLARGWTVRLETPTRVDAFRDGERLGLEPLLDPAGLDRLVVARTWPVDPAATGDALAEFAAELNGLLNVGQFQASPEGLVLQSALPFLDELEPQLLEAFLAFTAEVRLAVLRVQGERLLLAPVEGDAASR